MSNQYADNLRMIVEDKFECTAEEAMLKFEEEHLSYKQAGQMIGFREITMRKWATKCGVRLLSTRDSMKQFALRRQTLDGGNIFSHYWINDNLRLRLKLKID